jgi:hypothetical protein
MNANELYEQWIVNTGKNTNDPKIKIISFPISQDSLSSYFITHKPQIPEYDTERVPEKLFLSWNRRYREHRIAVVLMLEYLNLIERCYISFGATDPENQFMKLENSFNSYYTIDFLQPNDPCIDRLKSKLPLILDGETDVNQMCQDFNDANRSYYQNSLVSLITETNYNTNEVTLTEKSFKPIKEKHPFISIGTAGTVKALKKMGFKTFGEFWDESYDDIQEPKLRMVALVNIFKDIASWDAEKIKDFRRRVKPILDHNYEILKIKTSLNVVKEITNYITERTIV